MTYFVFAANEHFVCFNNDTIPIQIMNVRRSVSVLIRYDTIQSEMLIVQRDSFFNFILRHRFELRDFANSRPDGQLEYELAKYFSPLHMLGWQNQGEQLHKLFIALMVGSYMAEYGTDDHEGFSKYSAKLREDEWNFALRFCPYHEVDANLSNLLFIQSAMENAYLSLNTALASMEAMQSGGVSRLDVGDREQSKATSSLLTFTSLYATYIDGCRRIRKLAGLNEVKPYDRAIRRLTKKNSGQHSFIKDYRNLQSHYRIVEPYNQTEYGETKQSHLYISSSELLYSGYKWKRASRLFLQANDPVDVIDTTAAVLKDVKRVIQFHKKIVRNWMRREAHAYETYCREHERHKHRASSMFDIGGIFGMPTPLTKRLLEDKFVEQILNSALSQEEMQSMLFDMADRHRNLTNEVQEALKTDINRLVVRRPKFPLSTSTTGDRSTLSANPSPKAT